MTICSMTLDAVRKRLEEHKSLDEIGRELCDMVGSPRDKAIRLVRKLEDSDKKKYITEENADWLGYTISNVRKAPTVSDATTNLCDDSNRSKAIVNDTLLPIVPKVIISNKVITDSPKVNTVPNIENVETISTTESDKVAKYKEKIEIVPITEVAPPKIEKTETIPIKTKEQLCGWRDNLVKSNIDTITKTLPIIEILPIIDTAQKIYEPICKIGKHTPDCNICRHGYFNVDNWRCKLGQCQSGSCIVEDSKTCEALGCKFRTEKHDVYIAHLEDFHPDRKDLVEKFEYEFKKSLELNNRKDWIRKEIKDVYICSCGQGLGANSIINGEWYTKEELHEMANIMGNEWNNIIKRRIL